MAQPATLGGAFHETRDLNENQRVQPTANDTQQRL